MKLIIAGGRELNPDMQQLKTYLSQFNLEPTEIVCGGARGVDTAGELYGLKNGIQISRFPADWGNYGKSAGPKRNKHMAEYGDALLLIWTGLSKGSGNMLSEMEKLGKPVYQVVVTQTKTYYVDNTKRVIKSKGEK